MKKKTMIDTVFMPAIVSSLLGLSENTCYAQQPWSIQLEPMYMDVFGNDEHVANISTTTTTTTRVFSPDPPPIGTTTFTSTSTTTTESIGLDMEGDFTLRGQIEFAPSQWGVGLSGWWFDNDDSVGRDLNSGPTPPALPFPPPPTSTTTSTSVIYSSNNFFLVAPPSDSGSVLRTSAKGELEVWNVDVYGIRRLVEGQNIHVNITFGAKLGTIDKELSESATQTPATTVFDGRVTSSFNGRVTSSADTDVLAGPSIGIQAYARHGRHRFEGLLSQSVLIGDVDREVVSETESFSSFSGFSTSRASFSDSETELIPITELKLKYLYDVTANLSLGVGVFASVWVDTPVPSVTPTGFFFAPTSFSEPPEDTLGFLGGMAALNYRF
jgi:hypothetical protein